MDKNEFLEQYKDPRWQKKRLKILKRDDFMCQNCGDTKNTLNVHHTRYFKNRDLWDYKDDYFITLCVDCHNAISDLKHDIKAMIDDGFKYTDNLGQLAYIIIALSKLDPYQLFQIRKLLEK